MPTFQRHITGAQAVIDTLKTLGQPTAEVIAGNTNGQIETMWHYATEVGKELMSEYEWAFSRQELTLTLDGSITYDLPDDFNGFIGSSAWNRTTAFPVSGDFKPQVWQALKANNVLGTLNIVYRLLTDQLELLQDPGDSQEVVLPYFSRGWCRDESGNLQDNLIADTDVVLFDEILFKVALKRKWLIENKFDTGRVEQEYTAALNKAKARDTTAQTLSLAPARGAVFISVANVPETGYGST